MFDNKLKITFIAKFIFCIYIILLFLNLASVIGLDFTFGNFKAITLMPVFFIALIPFWLLLILRSHFYLKNYSRSYLWQMIKKTLPKELLMIFYFNVTYTVISFLVGFASFANFNNNHLREFQFFSGHLSIFFCVSFLGNVVFDNIKEKKCKNGHLITSVANFCPECGVQLVD